MVYKGLVKTGFTDTITEQIAIKTLKGISAYQYKSTSKSWLHFMLPCHTCSFKDDMTRKSFNDVTVLMKRENNVEN